MITTPSALDVRRAIVRHVGRDKVVMRDGWATRGRAWHYGIRGVVWHHTSSPAGDEGAREWFEARGETYPYCNALILRDGTVRLIAALSAYGSGTGGPWKSAGVPRDALHLMGFQVEFESLGVEDDLTPAQMRSGARLSCAIREVAGPDAFPNFARVIRHRDWTDGTAGVSDTPLPTAGRKNDVLKDIRDIRKACRSAWKRYGG